MNKEPRIAYCLYGLAGGAKGKGGKGPDPDVFRLGYIHAKKHILDINPNIDVFMHTWSVEYEQELMNLYNPVKYRFQPQLYFDVPRFIERGRSSKDKIDDLLNGYYSRWNSVKKAIGLKREHEISENFTYDFVMITRFDLAWQKDLIFNELNAENFYACHICKYDNFTSVGYWHRREELTRKKLSHTHIGWPYDNSTWALWDIWFIGNSSMMDSHSTIYDNLESYCMDDSIKTLKNTKSNKPNIKKFSNHLIPLIWLRKNNWTSRIKLHMHSLEDCPPVRLWYSCFHEGKHYR